MTTVLTGPHIRVQVAMTMRSALRIHQATGLQVNTAYTAKNMLRTAANITGEDYGTRKTVQAYNRAIVGLTQWLKTQGAE
jgi:hypothetical protein